MAAAAVSARIMSGGAAGLPLEAADRRGWAPSFAVVNCYAHGGAGLGAHSDRLTALGPAPIITSLTLGATRCFRLHRTCLYQLHSGSGGGGSASAQEAGASDIVRVDIELPHNSLLIMWPPCQECWTHEVDGGRGWVEACMYTC